MGAKDNKGQAKVRARGSHSVRGGVEKKKKKRKSQHNAAAELPNHAVPTAELQQSSKSDLGNGDLRVLLVGETDFSLAAALVLAWGESGDCTNLVASSSASEASTLALNDEAEDNVETVKAFGGTVLFKVGPTTLLEGPCASLHPRKGWQRIVVNLPVGTHSSAKAPSQQAQPSSGPLPAHRAVEAGQALLRGCFKAILSGRLLAKSGELHLTMRASDAASFNLTTIAKVAGLRIRGPVASAQSGLPGAKAQSGEAPVTYVLVEPPPKVDEEARRAAAVAAVAKKHPELRLSASGQTYKEAWKQRHRKGKR